MSLDPFPALYDNQFDTITGGSYPAKPYNAQCPVCSTLNLVDVNAPNNYVTMRGKVGGIQMTIEGYLCPDTCHPRFVRAMLQISGLLADDPKDM